MEEFAHTGAAVSRARSDRLTLGPIFWVIAPWKVSVSIELSDLGSVLFAKGNGRAWGCAIEDE